MGSIRDGVGDALGALALKDMDPSLLAFAIRREVDGRGVDGSALTAALELAALVHRTDARGTRANLPVDPYVTHPFRLVLRLLRYGCRDQAVLCAAALHDTVEDHPGDILALAGDRAPDPPSASRALAALGAEFGPEVARVVGAVTNPPWPPAAGEDERHRLYHAHVASAVDDPRTFLVKFADFVDNAGSLHHLTDDLRRARMERKYAPLVPILRAALDRHGAALGLDADGLARVEEHLAAIAARIAATLRR